LAGFRQDMSELVECHSGFAYEDRPVALTWEGQRLEIVWVLAEWRTPGKKYFHVCTTSGREFRLDYNMGTAVWQVEQV
jgi:hypothetical protein